MPNIHVKCDLQKLHVVVQVKRNSNALTNANVQSLLSATVLQSATAKFLEVSKGKLKISTLYLPCQERLNDNRRSSDAKLSNHDVLLLSCGNNSH